MQTLISDTSLRIARMLLSAQAVRLRPQEPFKWAAGWFSPIYCDNRLTLSFPHIREAVLVGLDNLKNDFFPHTEVVAGVATAGIPQATLLADTNSLPLVYVRSNSKGHGLQNQIEGRILPNQNVLVVEDLVSTGKSSLAAVDALRAAGANVVGMVAIFTYGFPEADAAFASAKVPLHTLTNYTDLLTVAAQDQLVAQADLATLAEWRKNPAVWKQG